MRTEIWEPLVQYWNTPEWKAKSSRNNINRGKSTSKHTFGSQTYVTLKFKADKILRCPATIDEIWLQSHGKKGTRPLDKFLRCGGGEGSKEVDGSKEIDPENNVEWVDSKIHPQRQGIRIYLQEMKSTTAARERNRKTRERKRKS